MMGGGGRVLQHGEGVGGVGGGGVEGYNEGFAAGGGGTIRGGGGWGRGWRSEGEAEYVRVRWWGVAGGRQEVCAWM